MSSPMFLSLIILFSLIHLSHSTGIVWLRLSSSEQVAVRIEVVDRSNTSRYGISLDVHLLPNVQKELVFPMPSSPSTSPIPIFDYTIQMLSLTGNRIGDKMGTRLPLLIGNPWINETVSQQNTIISTSIRFECLPGYYGLKCQIFCPTGEKCETDKYSEVKFEQRSVEKSVRKEQSAFLSTSRPLKDSLLLIIVIFLILAIIILLVGICILTRPTVYNRPICEPQIDYSNFTAFPHNTQFIV